VVELDGSSHDDAVEHDAERTAMLEARNIRVVRFKNADVMHRLPCVVSSISDAIV
jgi:very-short-patch-repair endonuclease